MTENDADAHTNLRAVMAARSFVALADTLVDDFDVVELLDRLVADCVQLLEVSAAAIMLVNRDRALEVVASSNEASRVMEVFQLESRSGPCIDAFTTGESVAVCELAELSRRWPDFGAVAEEAGFSAVYAFPLRLREQTIGALNLFSTDQPPLSDFDRRLGQALGDVATIAILQQRLLSSASDLAEQLQLALATRIVVEQAKGVIAEYGRVDMGVAFEAIRTYARDRRAKLSVVAQSLVSRELDPGAVISARPPE